MLLVDGVRMLKIFAVGIGAILLLGGLTVFWFSGEPTTRLVDASGNRLTAGTDAETTVPEASPFAEARALIEEEAFAAAREVLVDLLQATDRDGEACILLSDVCRQLEEAEAAVDFGLKAVELLPESAPAHLAYAQAIGLQMMQSGGGIAAIARMAPRLKRMTAECERVIELDPQDTDARTILAMTNMVLPKFLGGDIAHSVQLAKEIEALKPVEGKKLLALAYYRDEQVDQAIDLCISAAEEYPDEHGFHVTLGGFYADQERFSEADAAYDAARRGEKDADYYSSLYMQAAMRIDNEFEPERSVELLAEFIAAEPEGEFVPSVSRALYRQGSAHRQLGDIPAARQAFEASLALEPDLEEATEALAALAD